MHKYLFLAFHANRYGNKIRKIANEQCFLKNVFICFEKVWTKRQCKGIMKMIFSDDPMRRSIKICGVLAQVFFAGAP